MDSKHPRSCYPKASEAAEAAKIFTPSPQTQSDTYILAFADQKFLLRDEIRAVRLQLELLKPELALQERGIDGTIVMFGGTRVPDPETARKNLETAERNAARDPACQSTRQRAATARRVLEKCCYYNEARRLARMFTEQNNSGSAHQFVVATGGGPGIMEAANRGAFEGGGESIGLNIVLPREQSPNRYITPELCFQFHYFAIRKMHFLMRAKALVVFPGGYGTMDELFETLTLIQTKKIKPLPVLLFGREFWDKAINFSFLLEEGLIDPEDIHIFKYVETAEEAWRVIADFHAGVDAK